MQLVYVVYIWQGNILKTYPSVVVKSVGSTFTLYILRISMDHDANRIGMHPFSPDMHHACLFIRSRGGGRSRLTITYYGVQW